MPSVASTSDIEIAQRACILAGLQKPSSFSDTDSEVAIVLNDMYEDIITDALSIHPWRFANYDVTLGPPLAEAPLVGFTRAYAVPTDPRPLRIHTLYVSGSLVSHYRLKTNELHLDSTPTDEIVLEALWRVNEGLWPPWFRLYAQLRLASFLSASITRTASVAEFLAGEAEKQLVRSRTRDSQQQTTSKIRLTKIRSTRLGGRPMG